MNNDKMTDSEITHVMWTFAKDGPKSIQVLIGDSWCGTTAETLGDLAQVIFGKSPRKYRVKPKLREYWLVMLGGSILRIDTFPPSGGESNCEYVHVKEVIS